MKPRKIIFKSIVLILASSVLYTMCVKGDVMEDCPECLVIERTDIAITGDITADYFQMSSQNDDAVDLITYNFVGDQSSQIDFNIELNAGQQLVISLVDRETMNPWEQVGKPYNIYPNADLEDKLSYVMTDYLDKESGVVYATNDPSASVPGINLDAFKIIEYDGTMIRCRIRDMMLYSFANPDNLIHINGTFVGAVNFE